MLFLKASAKIRDYFIKSNDKEHTIVKVLYFFLT